MYTLLGSEFDPFSQPTETIIYKGDDLQHCFALIVIKHFESFRIKVEIEGFSTTCFKVAGPLLDPFRSVIS